MLKSSAVSHPAIVAALFSGAMFACSPPAGSVFARAGETPLTTVRVASGLSSPLLVSHAPGDFDRVFIVEQGGRIKILKNGQVLSPVFLNVSTLTNPVGERGLLGLAFHPNFAVNKRFYINYTNNVDDTVVAMYTVSSNPDIADANGDMVLTFDQPHSNHNGGWLGFGPDGYLYVATGDGGGQADPDDRGQSITGDLLGNILRIDVNGDDFPNDPNRDYAIPPGNPFVGRAGEDEIWAYGLRNPWRCAFDSETGDLWIADVGEDDWEEIDFQPAASAGGENYGWSCFEGMHCTSFGGCDCNAPATAPPIHEYPHGGSPPGCSITGGEVYRGCAIPGLAGAYFFADYCSNQIWSLRYDGVTARVVDRTAELAPAAPFSIASISSFGRDAFGEIYICDRSGGEVFKIVPAGGTATRIMASDPPNGAIDARTPLAKDGVSPVGWREALLGFDGFAGCLQKEDFSVTQQGGVQAAPAIANVEPAGADQLTITLDRPIEPRAWTTMTHVASRTSVRWGFLPGDVNADRTSAPADILDLIDFLNGVGAPRPIWSTDIDRSGLAAPPDILQLIDILNGAGNLDVYNGARLP